MIRVGLLGAASKVWLSYILQEALQKLEEHPMMEITAIIADDPADVGKTWGDMLEKTWLSDTPLPKKYSDLKLLPVEHAALKNANLDLVISALTGPTARALDPVVAAAGIPVVSESGGLRLEADIPLIVPEINADHLGIIPTQMANRNWDRGFIVTTPVCTAVIIALAMKPFVDAFGLESCVITTLQALSGAGPNGVSGMTIIDNLLPFIDQEEEKLQTELPKIFGHYSSGKLVPSSAPFSCTATRVPVRDGHTASISMSLSRPAPLDTLPALVDGYRGYAQNAGLQHAPKQPLYFRPEINRPQPRLDKDVENGMSVSIGRIRSAAALTNGLSILAVGHNHRRGTFGNTVLVAELLVKEGLVKPRS